MKLRELIRKDRKDKAMTQEEYSKMLGITRGTLSHLEIGRIPSADTAKKISIYFNKPINELLGNEEITRLANLDTTNLVIDSLIEKGEITEEFISEEARNLIRSSIELEIKLKLQIKKRG